MTAESNRPPATPAEASDAKPKHFIRQIIEQDVQAGKHGGQVITRFPPEPNGYLHIGHAKSICLNFGMAQEFGGRCHLRFDDTNPTAEEVEYVESIKADIRWLGFDWGEHLYFASDYFDQLYAFAEQLIVDGKAYVDELTSEEIRASRGTPTEPGEPSPHRDRDPAASLDLFRRMKAGEFDEGTKTLRARIDMASPNMQMRDPVMYRILKASHHRTGETWKIYPTYDFAHGQSDSIEGITHSLCTLEFEDHRPVYDWFIEQLGIHPSKQYEFARLNLNYTVMSKRKLIQLVREKYVDGWDDPRMPTLSGMRRRGYSPRSIRQFMEIIGVTKFKGVSDIALLENAVRDDLNKTSPRVMAVLDPLKITITNWPEGRVETVPAQNNPEDPAAGSRDLPFTRELWIDRADFLEDAPRKFFRLKPGGEVRLRNAWIVKCDEVIKNDAGEVVELRCSYDPDTLGRNPEDRKVKGVIHWVSTHHAVDAEVRIYDRLFQVEHPEADKETDFLTHLNPESLRIVTGKLEPSLKVAEPGWRCQFERVGYFCVDTRHSKHGAPVFNRTVPLRDSWKGSK
ncbi:MAG: glutamine--tRNA ligase/YqeY domain fusion protein [Opitutales bacterium]